MSQLADVHCHILPGIDDGARDLEDAVAMAHQAADDGIATVCATPHIRHDHDVRIDELADRVAELQAAVSEAALPVEVATGGEVAESTLDGLTSSELRAVSLGGANTWILLEPAPGPLGKGLVDAVGRLAEEGRRSIVAHPERHVGQGFRDVLQTLVAHGALVQATAAHMLDGHAGPVLAELAREGLVQLVGSDAHSARAGRPVAISAALDRFPPPLREFAAQAPAAILRGEAVRAPQADASGRST